MPKGEEGGRTLASMLRGGSENSNRSSSSLLNYDYFVINRHNIVEANELSLLC